MDSLELLHTSTSDARTDFDFVNKEIKGSEALEIKGSEAFTVNRHSSGVASQRLR